MMNNVRQNDEYNVHKFRQYDNYGCHLADEADEYICHFDEVKFFSASVVKKRNIKDSWKFLFFLILESATLLEVVLQSTT
jgi:hypothetical protein